MKQPKPRFNADRVAADMALKGWNNVDLARAAGISDKTVTRFLSGEVQTAKTAQLMARALGYTVKRYFSHVEAVA